MAQSLLRQESVTGCHVFGHIGGNLGPLVEQQGAVLELERMQIDPLQKTHPHTYPVAITFINAV